MDMAEQTGWVGTWSPGIGDPTFGGWFTVFMYFVGAYLCLLAFKRQKTTQDRDSGFAAYKDAIQSLWRTFKGFKRPLAEVPARARIAMFWFLLAVAFTLLGINKQLDLQSLVTEIGRLVISQLGLYDSRRVLQISFIVVVALVALGILYLLSRILHDLVPKVWLALLGFGITLTFVLIRASSFHNVDVLINLRFLGLRMNWILELTGIFIVAYAAARAEPSPILKKAITFKRPTA